MSHHDFMLYSMITEVGSHNELAGGCSASVHVITIGTSGELLVLCSIHGEGPAFQTIADFDL